MFQKRENTPARPPDRVARPSLEAVMALQKMLAEGRLDQLNDTVETAPPPEVSPRINRAEEVRPGAEGRSVAGGIGRFFRDLVGKLLLGRGSKKPIGGRSASGNV